MHLTGLHARTRSCSCNSNRNCFGYLLIGCGMLLRQQQHLGASCHEAVSLVLVSCPVEPRT